MWFFKKNKIEMTQSEVNEALRLLRIPTALTITPINLDEEKQKFLDSETYNPQFKYNIRLNNNEKVFSQLRSIKCISDVDPRISDFYMALIEDKREMSELLSKTSKNEAFSNLAKKRFGVPTLKQFNNACLILKGKTSSYNLVKQLKSDKVLKFDEIVNAIEITFKELELDGWKAKESLNIAKNGMKTGSKGKEVLIDKNIEKSPQLVRKSIVHEIGTHVLRSYNGATSGVPALYNANVSSYLDIEEGLALYNEELMGVLTYDYLKARALLLYAAYVGEHMSFRNLYNVIRGFSKPKEAFDTVYRVKRGLSDTSLPGIYTKDISYFRGFRKVKRAILKDESLYPKLYAGKIDLKMVGWVDDGLIAKPKIVPSKEKFDSIFRKIGI